MLALFITNCLWSVCPLRFVNFVGVSRVWGKKSEVMNFGRLRANDGQLEYPQCALFHLCCLRSRSVKHRLEIGSATLPHHIDSFPHGMPHDEELRGPPVLVRTRLIGNP